MVRVIKFIRFIRVKKALTKIENCWKYYDYAGIYIYACEACRRLNWLMTGHPFRLPWKFGKGINAISRIEASDEDETDDDDVANNDVANNDEYS